VKSDTLCRGGIEGCEGGIVRGGRKLTGGLFLGEGELKKTYLSSGLCNRGTRILTEGTLKDERQEGIQRVNCQSVGGSNQEPYRNNSLNVPGWGGEGPGGVQMGARLGR